MFEIIGLLFATSLLFFLAAVAGAVIAFIAWMLLPRSKPHIRWSTAGLGAFIPLATAAYLWGCIYALPGESLFDDHLGTLAKRILSPSPKQDA